MFSSSPLLKGLGSSNPSLSIELCTMVEELFFIHLVQYNNHEPPVAMSAGNVASMTEEVNF